MGRKHKLEKIDSHEKWAILKKEWLKTLTSPQDGMWESFRDNATNWGVIIDGHFIGYAAVNTDNQLIQFYIHPKYKLSGHSIFKELVQHLNITSGIVGTNNPAYFSHALNFAKHLEVHTFLFREYSKVDIKEKKGTLKQCQAEDIERIVNFCHYSLGAPKEWLNTYISGLVNKREIFSFEFNDKIIGTCEVRKSQSAPNFADIGMIVSPDFRKEGYGTYLLHKAKEIAIEWNKTPICSCEKQNIGSLKAIQNCGFISLHKLLSVTF